MTEQEKRELIEEIKKSLAEEKCARKTDGTHTVLKEPRDKWFRGKDYSWGGSLMGEAFGGGVTASQVWDMIRRLTCLIHGKQYVRHLVGDDTATETAEKLCQFVYDLRLEVKQNVNK